jgi:hypothetical protein
MNRNNNTAAFGAKQAVHDFELRRVKVIGQIQMEASAPADAS